MTNRLCLLLLLLVITAAEIACSGVGVNSLFGSSPERPATATPEHEKQYPIGPGSAGSGLEQLGSYQANLILDFEGIRNGETSAGRIESLTEVNRSTNALHQYLNVDAAIPNAKDVAGVSEFFRVGDKIYISRAGKSLSFRSVAGALVSPGEMGFFELDKLIVVPSAVSTVPQSEMLHGLKVQRYSFTQNDLKAQNIIFKKAYGNLWIAEPGDYIIQYVISATVRMVTPIPNAHILDKGRLTLSYTLTDIDTGISITLPAGVESGITPLADLPRLPDAEVTVIFPTLLEYTSAISPVSATLYYQNELPAQGWAEEKAEVFEEKSRLIFAKESETLTIIIAPIDDRDAVKVSINLDTQP